MRDVKELFKPHLQIPDRLMRTSYSHPGIGDAIEIPQGNYATSSFDPAKEYLHTQSLCACIGLGLRDIITKLTTLAHIDGKNDITKFFQEVLIPMYRDHSQPLEVGLAGGMEGKSERMLQEIYDNLSGLGNFRIYHFEVLDSSSVFDQRDMDVDIQRGFFRSGFPGFFSTYVSPDYELAKPLPSRRD